MMTDIMTSKILTFAFSYIVIGIGISVTGKQNASKS